RMDYTDEDAIEDLECLGGLRLDHKYLPLPMKTSLAFTFSFPEQETKLRVGDTCVRIDTGERLGEITMLDEPRGLVRIKTTKLIPDELSIGPTGPVDTEILRTALLRVADAAASGSPKFSAVMALLEKQPPRFRHPRAGGDPIIAGKESLLDEALAAVE